MKRAEPTITHARRCAIYTRKSSEEGLDQAFNSLHAQRDACEAYVLSQAGEGWTALAGIYDDGGWSGGSMERPALQKLLADIDRGFVDVVVVYKVDRLTRSLTDFARIVDAFDKRGVSFVSVTQAFNTTSSMGRLTLNVLLSFAQFEREVTGERIRDKIAQSKARGMWMGGTLPLGYDPPTDPTTRALAVNPAEAETVRLIFDRYLELRSAHVLQRWLEEAGVRSKLWLSTRGRQIGGAVFSRGALFHLLGNRVYLGEIPHKGRTYPGAHEAIVDAAVFDRTQALLTSARRRHAERPTRASTALLTGLIFDADGHPMSPTFTHGRKGRMHRYYVSAPLQQGRVLPDGEAIRRVPAAAIEDLVGACLRRLSCFSDQRTPTRSLENVEAGIPASLGSPDGSQFSERSVRPTGEHPMAPMRSFLERIEIHPTSVQLVMLRATLFPKASDPRQELATLERRLRVDEKIDFDESGRTKFRLTIACRMKLRGGRTWITTPAGGDAVSPTRIDTTLVNALRSAHAVLSACGGNPVGVPEAATPSRSPVDPYDRRLIRIAFLAPDIQRDILHGRQRAGLTLERLMHGRIPASWDEQRRLF